ncbi:hypothetical protein BA895_22045 [Humibacillus sp. DSM 29435]|uniref:hypothetical protein n=1 Tax=Humibacillus sp. DSM 29435 TaxID=1869167 RepID=UPI000871E1BF|nr:hypothetical protein [Humibacillus sp. DSM 29435]OFE15648.1 hypothetical protein BA895_22045 [Humibacillus sp. DSM 29435]
MRGRPPLLTNVAVMVAAVVIGWALLVGRDEPIGPDLGPAVQVRLSATTSAPSRPTPPPTGVPPTTSPPATATSRPAATGSAGSKTPTRVTPPTRVAPSSGAQTVPRHSPMPAGDDGDDDDDHDDGGDGDDGDGDGDD